MIDLHGKTILITGSARRIGRALALAVAQAGANLVLHHAHSPQEAAQVQSEIQAMGRQAWVLSADFNDPRQAESLVGRALDFSPLYALVNSAAIFGSFNWETTTLEDWQRHLDVNLTAPFLLSQAFARSLEADNSGRIINILDWRALRPAAGRLPYMISKAALAALTRSLALALAPRITVNGLALGAILPPSDGNLDPALIQRVPAGRWAELEEVSQALLFLLAGPSYITGEILHVDGGRHLV